MTKVSDEPSGLVAKFWRASLTILGATLALWLSAKLLLQVWWILAIVAAVVAVVVGLLQWWRLRRW